MPAEEVFIQEAAWRETFQGFRITDCAVRDRNIVYLLLREAIPMDQVSSRWDSQIPTRLAVLSLLEAEPRSRIGFQGLEDFRKPRCGVSRLPVAQGLAASSEGTVYAMGSGKKGIERVVADGDTAPLQKIRCLFGRAYAVGMRREVYRRSDVGRWECLSRGLWPLHPDEADPNVAFELGFSDIDGFSEDDLYAVGGSGDVWHYDGKAWRSCDFPTNWPLATVCCAEDGQVYISGEGGTLFRGREDVWRRIWRDEMTIPYNDTLWFDGALWLASDYRLAVLRDGEVQRASHQGAPVPMYGHMDAADGVLLVAGPHVVRLFDGERWRVLVRPYD